MSFSYYLCAFACYLHVAFGCGISTHTEIGYRAIEFFGYDPTDSTDFIRNILLNNQDAFQAGNPYPDSFYNSLCYDGIYHQKSEDTHWGHYVKIAFDYVNKKYPQPWSQETEKLVAFLFGIISHQVADINWHSLEGLQDGFLSVLGEHAFHGSFGDAHNYGDVADDMIGIFEWNVTTYAYEWYVPTLDLVEIYNDYYGIQENPITEDLINECAGMLLIGRLGEHIIGRSVYNYYVTKAPIMLDMFRDYFLGGLDDMSTWTNIVWRQAAIALLNGTENCDIPHNTLGITCDEDKDSIDWVVNMMSKNLKHDPGNLQLPFQHLLPSLHQLEFIKDARGISIKIPQMVVEQTSDKFQNMENAPQAENHLNDPSDLEPTIIITTRNSYGALGRDLKITDIDGNGKADLVASAPGVRGCVYIIMDLEELPNNGQIYYIEDTPMKVCSEDQYARFGFSFSVIDMNKDGVNDLVFGRPYSGAEFLQYHGGVSVYFGQKLDGEYMLERAPSLTYSCSESHCGLGKTIFSHQDDLFIGAPEAGAGGSQRGAVLRISADNRMSGHYSIPDDVPWTYTGSQDYEHFGDSISASQSSEMVCIGSPTFKYSTAEADIQVAGKVTLFSKNSAQTQQIIGNSEFNNLGSSADFVDLNIDGKIRNILAIGQMSSNSLSGNRTQTGSVLFYDLDSEDISDHLLSSISGNLEVGRFGMKVLKGWGDGLIVTAPYAGLGMHNYGKLYFFDGSTEYPEEVDSTSVCNFSQAPCLDEWKSLMLTTDESEALFGSQVSWFPSSDPGTVILGVAAERSSLGSRLGGTIYIYRVNL